MDVRIDEYMAGWMRWKNRSDDGWIDRCNIWMYGWIDVRMDWEMNSARMEGCEDRWWMDGYEDRLRDW